VKKKTQGQKLKETSRELKSALRMFENVCSSANSKYCAEEQRRQLLKEIKKLLRDFS